MPDDPFAILGLPRRFDLAPAEIERAYLAFAADAHPDLMADAVEAEIRSSLLNRARATLIDPERRAIALWEIWRREFGVAPPERADALPPAFLMQMMEIREELEASRNDADAMVRWSAWVETQRNGYQEQIKLLLHGLDPQSSKADAASALGQMKLLLNQWRYVERMLEQMS